MDENGRIDPLQICWRKTHYFRIARPKGEKNDTYVYEGEVCLLMAGGWVGGRVSQTKYDLKSWKNMIHNGWIVSFIPTFAREIVYLEKGAPGGWLLIQRNMQLTCKGENVSWLEWSFTRDVHQSRQLKEGGTINPKTYLPIHPSIHPFIHLNFKRKCTDESKPLCKRWDKSLTWYKEKNDFKKKWKKLKNEVKFIERKKQCNLKKF
jgi:hypothetical protein